MLRFLTSVKRMNLLSYVSSCEEEKSMLVLWSRLGLHRFEPRAHSGWRRH